MSCEIAIRETVPADLASIVEVHKRGCDRAAEPTGALNRPEYWRE